MSLRARARETYREQGILGIVRKGASYLPWLRQNYPWLLRLAYRKYVRPRLPEFGHRRWSGVRVAPRRKLLDPLVPAGWIPETEVDLPLYEATLIALLQEHVRENDRVVVVGGGYGVTTVAAARAAGRRGSVLCFEAVGERVRDIEEAVRLNRVETPVEVRHAVVARAVSLHGFGEDDTAPVVTPEDLPPCDVLEMDCEGAEIEILTGMSIRPRLILVETHGLYGAPTAAVKRILEEMGYAVTDAGVAEISMEQFCTESDIRILVAQSSRMGSGGGV
jgi:hypothetical protein